MSMPPAQGAYTCPYCRMASEGGDGTCPHCGAPVDVRRRVSDSGWVEQPPIRDMARIRFGRSTCQISGTYVPVADMGLHDDDWVYFSHHVLLHTEPRVRLGNLPMRGGWNRMRAGLPLIMMRAQGPGHIAFSADAPGETLAVPLRPGHGKLRAYRRVAPGRPSMWLSTASWSRRGMSAMTGKTPMCGSPRGTVTRQSGTTRSARQWTASRPQAVMASCCSTPPATPSSATWHRASGCWCSRAA